MLTLLNLSDAATIAAQGREIATLKKQRTHTTRSFKAGEVNRLTSDWVTAPTATRSELRRSLVRIRARSRDLARNNDYLKKFLLMCKSNVIGAHGIRLQVRAKATGDAIAAELDSTLNKVVESAFRTWGKKQTCSASGKLSWTGAQRLFVQTLARDGEVLVRLLRVRKTKANPFGLSLQFIDVSWLDEIYNDRLPNGNRVVMSVEVDDFDRPVAYYLTPPTDEFTYPGAMAGGGTQGRQRTRILADQIIHAYLIDDENQTRGLPWAHTVMVDTQMLDGYSEAELVAARAGACKTGFLKPEADAPFDGDEEEESEIESVEPGMVQKLPRGYDWINYDPSHPNNNYEGFMRGVLRGVAAGLGVSYTSLTGDLSQVNFSSIRAGLLEERDVWRALQEFVAESFCEPVYRAWLEMAFLNKAVEITASDYERVIEPAWQPRGWQWVDPLKDIKATVEAINNGLGTRTAALAEQGLDFEEVVSRLAEEQAMLDKHGIKITASNAAGNAAEKTDDKSMPDDE
jgi:lambda family phage portal protein